MIGITVLCSTTEDQAGIRGHVRCLIDVSRTCTLHAQAMIHIQTLQHSVCLYTDILLYTDRMYTNECTDRGEGFLLSCRQLLRFQVETLQR